MTDAQGWTQLYDGDMLGAVYTMFSYFLGGWFVTILFVVYQFMLWRKTESLELVLGTSLIFASLYAASPYVNMWARNFIFIMLAIEIAMYGYYIVMKK